MLTGRWLQSLRCVQVQLFGQNYSRSQNASGNKNIVCSDKLRELSIEPKERSSLFQLIVLVLLQYPTLLFTVLYNTQLFLVNNWSNNILTE